MNCHHQDPNVLQSQEEPQMQESGGIGCIRHQESSKVPAWSLYHPSFLYVKSQSFIHPQQIHDLQNYQPFQVSFHSCSGQSCILVGRWCSGYKEQAGKSESLYFTSTRTSTELWNARPPLTTLFTTEQLHFSLSSYILDSHTAIQKLQNVMSVIKTNIQTHLSHLVHSKRCLFLGELSACFSKLNSLTSPTNNCMPFPLFIFQIAISLHQETRT